MFVPLKKVSAWVREIFARRGDRFSERPRVRPGTILRTHLAVTALEDRTMPAQVVTIITLADTTEGGLTGAFRVARSETTGTLGIGVDLSGTAGQGYDYSINPMYAYFEDGVAEVVLHVFPADDSTSEPTETIVATVNYGGTPSSATLNIADNDPPMPPPTEPPIPPPPTGLPIVAVEKIANAAEIGTVGVIRFTRTGDLSQPLTAGLPHYIVCNSLQHMK